MSLDFDNGPAPRKPQDQQPVSLPCFQSQEELLETLLMEGGAQPGKDYLVIKYLRDADKLLVLGIQDESAWMKIQSIVASQCPELNMISRGWCGSSYALICSSYDEFNLSGEDEDRQTEREAAEALTLKFFPELIVNSQEARNFLAEQGLQWMIDYDSIDCDQECGGIDVGGIKNQVSAQRVQSILSTALPTLHHSLRYFKSPTAHEPGWHVLLSGLSSRSDDQQNFGKLLHLEPLNKFSSWSLVLGWGLRDAYATVGSADDFLLSIKQLRNELAVAGVYLPETVVTDDINLERESARIEIGGTQVVQIDNVKDKSEIMTALRSAAVRVQ